MAMLTWLCQKNVTSCSWFALYNYKQDSRALHGTSICIFFTKYMLWLTHAGVIPCVKTNDISRILSENWYLENVIEKWKMRDKVRRSGAWWWLVVEMGGGMGMDGAGRRQRPPCMLDCSRDLFLFNCWAMRLREIMMWREVWVSFVKLS